jgi:hypothetical protein
LRSVWAWLEAPGAIRSRLGAPCEAVEKLCGLRIKPTPACSWMCQQMNRARGPHFPSNQDLV